MLVALSKVTKASTEALITFVKELEMGENLTVVRAKFPTLNWAVFATMKEVHGA
jgi:hypothetical protein